MTRTPLATPAALRTSDFSYLFQAIPMEPRLYGWRGWRSRSHGGRRSCRGVWRRRSGQSAGTSTLGMLVDLSARIYGEDGGHSRIAVGQDEDTPTANARFAHTGAVSKRSRQAGINGIDGELPEPGADALLRWTIKAIQYLFGLVGDYDLATHTPRSRSYWPIDFTRPAETSASPRSNEARAAAAREGPSASTASARSSKHIRARSA